MHDNGSAPALWQARHADFEAASTLAAQLGCPLPIAQMLTSRGATTPAAAHAFLSPTFEAFLADPDNHPDQLLGMAAAVARILAAIRTCEPILIYGDYDVDGTAATVLLKTTIERIGFALDPQKPQRVSYHVPHRIREGYGMQNAILGGAAAEGIRLVISVDTGIRAIAEAAEARSLGLDLVVTDHHLPDSAAMPEALAVINPNQSGCPYPNKHLCGAAVAFKLAHALLLAAAPLTPDPTAFNARTNGILLPAFLKLVAIATIADSVPLVGENRMITALGLAALATPVQPGLRALMELAKIPGHRAPTATEVGFRLAPRINAAGRMDVAGDVVELFLTRDPARAKALAEKLDSLNQARRDSEARALDAIDRELLALIDADGQYPPACIILDHPEWHRGVLGILASRIVDRTGRPALVLTHADGDAHGSGRSIPGFHLLDALSAAAADTTDSGDATGVALFHRFGGHAHAVGFSLASDRLPLLRARISAYATPRLNAPLLSPPLDYDAEIPLTSINPELYAWIGRCAPFGVGNSEPVFLTRNAVLAGPIRPIKDKHICLLLTQADGSTNVLTISALGWSRGPAESSSWAARCVRLGLGQGSIVDILFRLKQNTGPYSNGSPNGLELELCDLRPAAAPES